MSSFHTYMGFSDPDLAFSGNNFLAPSHAARTCAIVALRAAPESRFSIILRISSISLAPARARLLGWLFCVRSRLMRAWRLSRSPPIMLLLQLEKIVP